MKKTLKKRFDLTVSVENSNPSQSYELDKNVTAIIGLLVTSNREDMLYYRGTQKLEINGEEIFPDDYECKLLMAGLNVAPGNKYYDMGGMKPGNRTIKVNFKDVPTDILAFAPYRVSYYFICEIE